MIETIQRVKCDLCLHRPENPKDDVHYSQVKIEPIKLDGHQLISCDKREFHLCPACTRNLRNFIEIPF